MYLDQFLTNRKISDDKKNQPKASNLAFPIKCRKIG